MPVTFIAEPNMSFSYSLSPPLFNKELFSLSSNSFHISLKFSDLTEETSVFASSLLITEFESVYKFQKLNFMKLAIAYAINLPFS